MIPLIATNSATNFVNRPGLYAYTAPPKPNLAVAFKTKHVIEKTELLDVGFLKGHMCAELAKGANESWRYCTQFGID